MLVFENLGRVVVGGAGVSCGFRWSPLEHVVILSSTKWGEESSSTERTGKGVPTETVET